MDSGMITDLFRDAIGVALKIATPMLLLSMLVGVVVAIFQAVTQIHEQIIGFVLKLIVVVSVLLIGGGWMMDTLQDFTREVFSLIAS